SKTSSLRRDTGLDFRGAPGHCPYEIARRVLQRNSGPGRSPRASKRRTIELLGPRTHESAGRTGPAPIRVRRGPSGSSTPWELHSRGNLSEFGSVPVAPVLPVHEVARR